MNYAIKTVQDFEATSSANKFQYKSQMVNGNNNKLVTSVSLKPKKMNIYQKKEEEFNKLKEKKLLEMREKFEEMLPSLPSS